MPAFTWRRGLFLLIALIAFCTTTLAQQKKRGHRVRKTDSALLDLNSKISDSLLQEAEIKDTVVPNMVNKVESYSFRLNRAESYLTQKLDTFGILKSLQGVERGLNFLHTRLQQSDHPLNLRNLNTASVLLQESRGRLQDWKSMLDTSSADMDKNHDHIRTIKHDSSLLNASLDSVLHGEMKAVHDRSLSLDSLQHNAIAKINALRNRVAINILMVRDLESEIRYRMAQLRDGMLRPEEPPLLAARPADYDANLQSIATEAVTRSFRILKIFMVTTWDTRSVNYLVWLILFAWFLFSVLHIGRQPNGEAVLNNVKFLKRSAFLSSLLLLFTYANFTYENIPAVYLHTNGLLRLLALSILLFPFLTKIGRTIWIVVALLWVGTAIDDLLLDSAFGERWLLAGANILLSALCVLMMSRRLNLFRNIEDSPARLLVLAGVLLQALISVVSNFAGCFILAKLFAISAIDSLVLAVTLKLCSAILVDAVYMQSEEFHNNRFSAFLNFVNLKNKLKKILWVATTLIWLFSILRNLTFYDPVYHFLSFFFNKTRTIGSFNFTLSSLVVFLLVIWISSVLSRFVSFFFSQPRKSADQKKSKLGSVALIVRIAIWTVGLMIAVAAAGIPITQISILVGALGVGIGFGLQNLVNNLVSGIIIAFERPIQIGDTIEISGKTGVVQDIGVRSSRMNNDEGASVIIPNGDLLSQQLINWTLNSRNRRVHFQLTVPFKTDYRKARELAEQVIRGNEKVLKDPEPAVTVDSYANNAVNFDVSFWVPDLAETGSLKNELMLDIFEAFGKNGIVLG